MQTKTSRVTSGKDYAAEYKTIRQTDYITRHRIYNRLIELLSNPRIKHRRSGNVLPYIFHPQAFIPERERIEADIFYFAEHHALDYEVVRNVPKNLYGELRREGREDLIFDCRIVPLPNFILNALVCETLEKEFSRASLLAAGGFVLREGYIRLDLDERLVGRGFMMPVRCDKGLITALKVFRYPNDEKPFILKSRSGWRREIWR